MIFHFKKIESISQCVGNNSVGALYRILYSFWQKYKKRLTFVLENLGFKNKINIKHI